MHGILRSLSLFFPAPLSLFLELKNRQTQTVICVTFLNDAAQISKKEIFQLYKILHLKAPLFYLMIFFLLEKILEASQLFLKHIGIPLVKKLLFKKNGKKGNRKLVGPILTYVTFCNSSSCRGTGNEFSAWAKDAHTKKVIGVVLVVTNLTRLAIVGSRDNLEPRVTIGLTRK